eukprot:4984010-Pleurochrysis_carterae.AAC.1
MMFGELAAMACVRVGRREFSCESGGENGCAQQGRTGSEGVGELSQTNTEDGRCLSERARNS